MDKIRKLYYGEDYRNDKEMPIRRFGILLE
jgi:hypothetical protein